VADVDAFGKPRIVFTKPLGLERLLAEGVSKTNKQTVRSTRTNFLTFSSTALTRKFPLSLANNAEITAEDIYEGPRRRLRQTGPLSLPLCASSQNSPAGNTVLYHLRTKFEPEQLERVAMLLRKDLDELLPEQVEVCADLHLRLLR